MKDVILQFLKSNFKMLLEKRCTVSDDTIISLFSILEKFYDSKNIENILKIS